MGKKFSEQNFELKVFLNYIIFKAKGGNKLKSIYQSAEENNIEELNKFVDTLEFTYINLKRLETEDEELKPLITEFIEIYEFALKQVEENNKVLVLKEEGNVNDEKSIN